MYDDIEKEEATGQKTAFEWDDDLPGARARARGLALAGSAGCALTDSRRRRRRAVLLRRDGQALFGSARARLAQKEPRIQAKARHPLVRPRAGGSSKGRARATLRRRFSLSWRRVKVLKEEAKYTQAEAEWGAGKTAEILPPAHGAAAGGAAMS